MVGGKKRIFYENYEIQVSLSQNNIFFKHHHGHLFLGYLWLFSHDNVVTAEIIRPEKPKYLLPGSLQKNLADSLPSPTFSYMWRGRVISEAYLFTYLNIQNLESSLTLALEI